MFESGFDDPECLSFGTAYLRLLGSFLSVASPSLQWTEVVIEILLCPDGIWEVVGIVLKRAIREGSEIDRTDVLFFVVHLLGVVKAAVTKSLRERDPGAFVLFPSPVSRSRRSLLSLGERESRMAVELARVVVEEEEDSLPNKQG